VKFNRKEREVFTQSSLSFFARNPDNYWGQERKAFFNIIFAVKKSNSNIFLYYLHGSKKIKCFKTKHHEN
jgi:hypothetical protein